MPQFDSVYLPVHQEEVVNFYFLKRGKLPTPAEALDYLKEEIRELMEAVDAIRYSENPDSRSLIEHYAKESADVKFTLYGLDIALGVDGDKAFQLVCESNMTKERTEDGKVQKGENYVEPDMSGAIL